MDLHAAAWNGNKSDLIKALGKGEAINEVDSDSNTALHYACGQGHKDCTVELLNRRANTEVANKFGTKPLHEACRNGHIDCVRSLIKFADIDARDKDSWTALHYAALNPNDSASIQLSQILLDNKADINAINSAGQTALFVAASRGSVQLMSFLIKNGARIDVKDSKGRTAFSYLYLQQATKPAAKASPPVPSASKELSNNFKSLLNSKNFSDISFTFLSDGSLYAHKCVISARCSALLPSEDSSSQVKIDYTSKTAFLGLLEWIYTAAVEKLESTTSHSFSLELLSLADRLKIKNLQEVCENSLMNTLGPKSDLKKDLRLLLEVVKNRESSPSPFLSYLVHHVMKCLIGVDSTTAKSLDSNDVAALIKLISISPEKLEPVKPASVLKFSKRETDSEPVMGLSEKNLRLCKNIHRQLMKDEHAWPFLEPVDPIKLNIPDYFNVIDHPMDFGTIQKNLDEGRYLTLIEWIADERLVFQNAVTYNGKSSEVGKCAEKLRANFEQRMAGSSFDKPGKAAKPRTPKEVPKSAANSAQKPASAAKAATPKTPATSEPKSSSSSSASAQKRKAADLPLVERSEPKVQKSQKSETTSATPLSSKKRKVEEEPKLPSRPSSAENKPKPAEVKETREVVKPKEEPPKPTTSSKIVIRRQAETPPMTFEEKKKLGEMMNHLSSNELLDAVEIISESKKLNPQNEDDDTLDIDMNDLDDTTLRKLQHFISECFKKRDAVVT
eukprot:TRINITY_DN10314_c0_g1_i1.p1 TRINITY_DN10314_c0_g1~~TRINITY_DN10314_c0_g1_i1.p1  ORF type:complete len:730 (-),score=233.39 TRINITY_DN10314_c0_g1_i1:29-2218(-)